MLIVSKVKLTVLCLCVLVSTVVVNQGPIFAIIDAKIYLPVVTLSTQDNAKLLHQLKPGFKRTNN